jgi:hypothetical protein
MTLRNYPQHETIHLNILDKPLDAEMERIPLEERSRARLLWGHMPYGAHKHMPRRCEYITVLREPIGRVISVYKHILSTPSHKLHDRLFEGKIGLEEYIESGMDMGQTHNSQTRQLSGWQFGPLNREALEEAKRNLQGFLVAGLTERFEETIVLLRRVLGLRFPLYVTRNVSRPLDVSERAVTLISARNELDRELYAFGRDLFLEKIARQDRSFALEVSIFRALRPLSRATGRAADVLRARSHTRISSRISR